MNSPPAPTFNLLQDPWIPVRPAPGGPVREVGLRELLLNGRAYGRIDDPSPLVSVTLLHQALNGPRTMKQAVNLCA